MGAGQVSLLHLADYIHSKMLPAMQSRVASLRHSYANAEPPEREKMEEQVAELPLLIPKKYTSTYLKKDGRDEIPTIFTREQDEQIPELLKLTPLDLIGRLSQFRSAYRAPLT